MGTSAPDLLPIFRSRFQADLLTRVYLSPEREFSITELSALLDHPISTTQREVDRLVVAGLVTEHRVGRTRLIRANTGTAVYRPLAQLLAASFGPPAIIADEFAAVKDIHALKIFGSWAARYHGHPGPQPVDIDLLVIGSPLRGDVYDAAERAEHRLGLSVNAVIRTVMSWQSSADGLIQQIKGSPVLDVATPPGPEAQSALDSR
ncbi:ArsR family transcriptional regulator [Sphaerisporangium rubeum]|uniref:Putative nucleotidyltransferase n=1 Tax=Sphaerisporangium rubeum TaxID=321317 RepID=A0A7X0IHM7_9ACTN|nr:ArsR family transcriptional regulator [Sphaerisporangium rubeum]MBB6475410.1 putative nucleotidyltransferase [Sphaerisporangium rubeum]